MNLSNDYKWVLVSEEIVEPSNKSFEELLVEVNSTPSFSHQAFLGFLRDFPVNNLLKKKKKVTKEEKEKNRV